MKAEPKVEAAAPKASSKKLMIMVLMALLVLGGGGGTAWFFLRPTGAQKEEVKESKFEKPVYVPIDQFTVNLQREDDDKVMQIQFTLQVADGKEEMLIKDNMPKVRGRLLLLLSSKKASELETVDGKRQLAQQILEAVNEPFAPTGKPQKATDVSFTNFIIQ